MSAKQQFADTFERESATTRRVIHSMPESKASIAPYPGGKSPRELAFVFSMGQGGIAAAMSNQWQWPPQRPAVPATYAEVLQAFDATADAARKAIAAAPETRLAERVQFFTAPKTLGEIPVQDLIWFMLLDGIHHRGQFSTYLRLAGEKVPSIYGPTHDDPWM
jgi:uncharacterized damage-inducible protein DinB